MRFSNVCIFYSQQFAADRPALELAKNLFGQGILKQMLTEGKMLFIIS